MKKIFTLLFIAGIFLMSQKALAQNPTIYSMVSASGGAWGVAGTAGVWETFSNTLGTNTPGPRTGGTATTSIPTGTSFVYIRNGQTVTMGASKNCLGMFIEAGGSLIAGGAFTLKVDAGGTGFTGNLSYSITNNGIMGLSTESMILEVPTTAANVLFTGAGAYNVGRLRIVGGNTNSPVVTLDASMTFNQSANYALSAAYNGTATDNVTLTINAGKVITISNASGYVNSNPTTPGGTYTYNINGTLDMSASVQTAANLTAFSPTDGVENINVGPSGLIKTGAAFNASPVAPGVTNFNIAAGGLVDATLATTFNIVGAGFVTNATGALRRTVLADGSLTKFPLRTAGGNITQAAIAKITSPSVIGASVKNTFDNAPSDLTKVVQKQWDLSLISGAAAASDTVKLSWLTGDQGSAFDPMGSVTIMHYTGGAYEYKPATVTGSGTAADPYVASAYGFTSYSPFGVGNLGVVPLSLLNFTGIYTSKGSLLNWATSNEINVSNFGIEKSTDGINFKNIGTVSAANVVANNYQFTDGSFISGVAYYRIKMNDNNGRFTYSKTVIIHADKNAALSIYPNPANDNISVAHAVAGANTIINIYSTDGKLLISKKAVAGAIKTDVNVGGLKTGNYSISVNDDAQKSTSTFIKQ